MQFTITLQEAYELEANATSMSTTKIKKKINLEKQWGAQSTIKRLIIDDTKITEQTFVLTVIRMIFMKHFLKNANKRPNKKCLKYCRCSKTLRGSNKALSGRFNRKRFTQVPKKHGKW